MNMNVIHAVGLAVFLSLGGVAHADPASAESLKKLMQATGAGQMGKQVANQMIPSLKRMMPDASEQFWIEVRAEINGDELEDLIIPVYQKHLTEADVEALNAFYQTPAGRKLISIQPDIMRESLVISRLWGQKLAQRIIDKYRTDEQN